MLECVELKDPLHRVVVSALINLNSVLIKITMNE